jgi:hypothetical protein
MARIPSSEFNPAVPVLVRRFFVAAGRHWSPGDPFTWQRLAVDQRRVKQLFDAGKLMHPADGGVVARPARMPSMGETPSEQTIQTEVENDEILANAAASDEPMDDLTDLGMKELRAIADEINAPSRVSREAQREAIRETRRAQAASAEE